MLKSIKSSSMSLPPPSNPSPKRIFCHETPQMRLIFYRALSLFVSLLVLSKLFKRCCQMLFARFCGECRTHVSDTKHRRWAILRSLWSAQRNLLNSFINFPRDWKINYHFCRFPCAGFIISHTAHAGTPLYGIGATWFMSSPFHSHFSPTSLLVSRAMLDSFMEIFVERIQIMLKVLHVMLYKNLQVYCRLLNSWFKQKLNICRRIFLKKL